jgi:2-methylcitrate dehydratase PrpD
MIQAQFSIPYVVTMVLMGEPTGPNWYRENMFKDPKVRKLQHKIKLEEDPVATRKIYAEHKATSTVEILTINGKKFNKHVEYPKGERENPFTQRDHIDKFKNMASWLGMQPSQIDELMEMLNNLEKVGKVSELTRLLVP